MKPLHVPDGTVEALKWLALALMTGFVEDVRDNLRLSQGADELLSMLKRLGFKVGIIISVGYDMKLVRR